MTREQFSGQVRELLNVTGAAVAAWGLYSGNQIEAISGVLLSVVMLAWGFRNKDSVDMLMSLIRKVAGALGAAMVTFELLDEEKATAMLAVLGPLFAIVSSHWHHTGKMPGGGGKLPVVILAFGLVFFLPSCTVTLDESGNPVFGIDPVEAGRVIEQIQEPGVDAPGK
jgi:ABC-type multidrug transport system fused ATPase/permease subunit